MPILLHLFPAIFLPPGVVKSLPVVTSLMQLQLLGNDDIYNVVARLTMTSQYIYMVMSQYIGNDDKYIRVGPMTVAR